MFTPPILQPLPSAPYPQECLLECNPHTRALRFTLNASYIWTRTHSYAHRVRTRCIPLLSPVREPHCSHRNARTLTESYSDGGRRRQSRGRYALVRGDIPHGKNVLGMDLLQMCLPTLSAPLSLLIVTPGWE